MTNQPGAVKVPQALGAAYSDAMQRIPAADASVIRKYVATVNAEAAQWRRRFRDAQGQLLKAKTGAA